MKKICAMLFMLLSASASFAQHGDDAVVRWKSIVGVIATQQDTNPVSKNIDSGTFAWSTAGGRARVNLATGAAAFSVEGLVINGTQFSGTPGPVTSVTGTLVCNASTDQEFTLDSPPRRSQPFGKRQVFGLAVQWAAYLFLREPSLPDPDLQHRTGTGTLDRYRCATLFW
jgi:hypothetical protein